MSGSAVAARGLRSEDAGEDRPHLDALIASTLGFVSLTLGLATLGSKSLWYDEAYNALRVREEWGEFVATTVFGHEASQALFLMLLKPWVALTSDGEWALRFPSTVFASATVSLSYVLSRRLGHPRSVGIVAGLILATNPMMTYWSQQARTYTLATLASVAATLLFVEAVRRDERVSWVRYAICAGLGLYAHFFVGLVVLAHAATLGTRRQRPSRINLAVATGILLALAAPIVFFVLTRDEGQISWIPSLGPGRIRFSAEEILGRSPVLLGVVLIGVYRLCRSTDSPGLSSWRRLLLLYWLMLPPMAIVVASLVRPLLEPRYLIVILPAVALTASVGIFTLRSPGVRGVLIVLVLASSIAAVIDEYRDRPLQDWRGAVEYAMARRAPGDEVRLFPLNDEEPYLYYGGQTASTGNPSGTVWVMVGGNAKFGYDPVLTRAQADSLLDNGRWELVETRRFDGVTVYRFRFGGA